jgi:hypothetical protein
MECELIYLNLFIYLFSDGSMGPIILAIIVTIILLIFPREDLSIAQEVDIQVKIERKEIKRNNKYFTAG